MVACHTSFRTSQLRFPTSQQLVHNHCPLAPVNKKGVAKGSSLITPLVVESRIYLEILHVDNHFI